MGKGIESRPVSPAVAFRVVGCDPGGGAGRVGVLSTPHGEVETPAFCPVGTRGTVRGLTPEQVRATGSRMLLANAYHLALRPGAEVVRALGGLHRLMAWDGPILADSGGYQVFSLAEPEGTGNDAPPRRPRARGASPGASAGVWVTDDGVRFRSPVDGSEMFLGPRETVALQEALGADIAMVLDECVAAGAPPGAVAAAAARTGRWARAALDARGRSDQALFGIVQGGLDPGLRAACAREIAGMPFDGFALGGLGVGEAASARDSIVAATVPLLPEGRARYLMGIGTPGDLVASAALGVDLADCVIPTRNGRNGEVYTREGTLRLRNAVHARDLRPLDAACRCACCGGGFSRGTLRHLFLADEMLGPILASIHNLTFYQDLMAAVREAIPRGDLLRVAAMARRSEEPA